MKKMTQLDLLLKALTELYPRDPLSPGVTIAWLPDKQTFYGSIKRYNTKDPHSFEILLSVEEPTSAEVIKELASGWFSRTIHVRQLKECTSLKAIRRKMPLKRKAGK